MSDVDPSGAGSSPESLTRSMPGTRSRLMRGQCRVRSSSSQLLGDDDDDRLARRPGGGLPAPRDLQTAPMAGARKAHSYSDKRHWE
jgi:hypothetical protein